jgi:hypothetical protein
MFYSAYIRFIQILCLKMQHLIDRLCGLVAGVLGYRSGGPGSIPGTTRFSEGEKKGKQ